MSGQAYGQRVGETIELPGGVRMMFTNRVHGDLSPGAGGDGPLASASRAHLRDGLGLRQLLGVRQVHGSSVRVLADEEHPRASVQADGQATALRGVGLLMLVADCLPVALGAPGGVAMLHAGWRGLAGGVIEQGVGALRELVGEQELTAVIGPGAGVCCYEAGAEVHGAFGGAHRVARNVDLRAIARERLERVGVASVHELAACTICDERFFSYRREGARAGRQGGVAWLS